MYRTQYSVIVRAVVIQTRGGEGVPHVAMSKGTLQNGIMTKQRDSSQKISRERALGAAPPFGRPKKGTHDRFLPVRPPLSSL